MSDENKIKVGITQGDINGIGFEVIIKTLADARILDLCTPIIYGASRVASYHRKAVDIADFAFNTIHNADESHPRRINLVNIFDREVKVDLGESTVIAGEQSILALNAAIEDLKRGKINVLVTAPINKFNIQQAGFPFPGHTEYLAQQFGAQDHLMFLVHDKLRIGVATEHVALSKVPELLTTELILHKIRTMHLSLVKDFGIRKPRIAVLGLNPHAGDGGVMGNEEATIIAPAIKAATDEKILAFGPYAPDGFFGVMQFDRFDGILAMYHDQGLIPFKTLAFENGVNFTAGLPVIRTSPDHGTAYEIAGKNEASPNSFREALYLACNIYSNRTEYFENHANPLKVVTRINKQEDDPDVSELENLTE
ncbi:MAG: 4-hydroxythreonine-4-phosphate dehydrogenase PdxA [Bacteroidota bacterium]